MSFEDKIHDGNRTLEEDGEAVDSATDWPLAGHRDDDAITAKHRTLDFLQQGHCGPAWSSTKCHEAGVEDHRS